MNETLPLPSPVESPQQPERRLRRIIRLFHGGLRELATPTERRNPYLDGLRTIAVLLVINGHCAEAISGAFGPNRYAGFTLTANGWIGVDLFYVLSGFFIGSQLWRELDRTRTIALGKFMVRRGLRIWPLYFFIFACAALMNPGMLAAKQHGWSDLVFLTNYLPHGIVLGGWSLCTEEQFYLVAPLALLLIGWHSRKSYRYGLLVLFGLEWVVRAATYYLHAGHHLFVRDPAAFATIYYPFHTHCDGLIAGLFIANLAGDPAAKRTVRRPWLFALAGLVLLLAAKRLQPETLDFTGLALFFGALVWWGTQRTLRLFDSRLFYWFSRLSFGMYLLHPYLIPATLRFVLPHLHRLGMPLSTMLCAVVLAIAAALVSCVTFCLVEHPFLVLRTAVLRKREVVPLVAT
jgi:peptidoglycan/LPS O-acetylase OafA/YrhL